MERALNKGQIIRLAVPWTGPGAEREHIVFTADFSARGLRSLQMAHREPDALMLESGAGLEVVRDALLRRLAGRDANLPWEFFDLEDQPPFHQRVWRAMREIPFGKIATYSDVARAAGSPRAFRACGQACHANPILLFIPCHRVVATSGPGGFGGGLNWKRRFLALEGVTSEQLDSPEKRYEVNFPSLS